MEKLRLIKNKIRIWFLGIPVVGRLFGRVVKKIKVETADGRKHDVTVEQHQEKVCVHDLLRQISAMVWQCDKCKEVYFNISYKVMGTKAEILNEVETLRKHFKLDDGEKNQ